MAWLAPALALALTAVLLVFDPPGAVALDVAVASLFLPSTPLLADGLELGGGAGCG